MAAFVLTAVFLCLMSAIIGKWWSSGIRRRLFYRQPAFGRRNRLYASRNVQRRIARAMTALGCWGAGLAAPLYVALVAAH
jgi:hypothetical protein